MKLVGVQWLRGIAAIMVVIYHCARVIPTFKPHLLLAGLTERLPEGVDIFFVISGFIMVATTANMKPVDFASRRIMRIVPLYWLLTLVLAASVVLPPHFFKTITVNFEFLAKSLLFMPYRHDGVMGPLLVPGWTLDVEMFFYAVFTLALFLPARNLRFVLIAAFFVILTAIGRHINISRPWEYLLTRSYILEFALGMGIASLPKLSRSLAVAMIAGGAVGLFVAPEPDVPICAFLLVCGVVKAEQNTRFPDAPILVLLGDASYSIYLSHVLVMGAVKNAWERLHLVHDTALSAGIFLIFVTTSSVIVAIGIFKLIEKPCQDWMHARYKEWRLHPAKYRQVAP